MGRRAPRPLSAALGAVQSSLSPPTLLAAAQAAWPAAVGQAIAAVAEPVSEREGVITVRCADSVWAEELSLMAADLTVKLRAEIEGSPSFELRFRSN